MLRRALATIGAIALAGLVGFGLGWWRCSSGQALTETRAELHASETLRTEEHTHAAAEIRAVDNLAMARQARQPRVLAARGDLVRLQQSSLRLEAAAAAAPASAACGPDPRLAGVLELLREGAGLVEEGSRLAGDLRDQRDALAASPQR